MLISLATELVKYNIRIQFKSGCLNYYLKFKHLIFDFIPGSVEFAYLIHSSTELEEFVENNEVILFYIPL